MTSYAILGHPVSHSLSPLIHTTAFEALGIDARYEAIDLEPDELSEGVRRLQDEGFAGFNVTIPHKETILPMLDDVDAGAQLIGAVNTVVRNGGKWAGVNTDVTGFLKCIEPYADQIRNEHVVVLGAGGAARAVIYALRKEIQPSSILILNRSIDRAEDLAAGINTGDGPPVTAESLFQDGLQALVDKAGVIVNATSVGMKPYAAATPLEDVKFRKNLLVVDLIYTPFETTLMSAVRKSGGTAIGGLEMLLHQAAASFRLWTGKELPMSPVRTKVEEALQEGT